MLILKIKQTETALNDGRLDEAFELLQDNDLRQHRRGQLLLGRLAQALTQRSRQHLENQSFSQAMEDVKKAQQLSGSIAEVADLHRAINEALKNQHHSQRQQAQDIARAREHLDNGHLSAVHGLLKDAQPNGDRSASILQEANQRRQAVNTPLQRAEKALQQQDWPAAVDELLKAKNLHSSSEKLVDLIRQLTTGLTQCIKNTLQNGRLDRAAALLDKLELLVGSTIELQELRRFVSQCRRAFEHIEQGRAQQATILLQRLSSLLPETAWLDEAIQNCHQMAQSLQALRIGPLAMLGSSYSDLPDNEKPLESNTAKVFSPPKNQPILPENSEPLPAKFLIQIDGVGSFLVFREPIVSLGPISSTDHCDLPFIAHPQLPVVNLERSDDDYFIRSPRPIEVNNTPVTNHLLAHEDRIALSDRCRLQFFRPNAASSSAVLSLSSARLPRPDVRQVILLDRELILGPGPLTHIRADRLTEKAIMFLHGGRLFCRSKAQVTLDANLIDRSTPLPLDKPVKIGELSLVLTKL